MSWQTRMARAIHTFSFLDEPNNPSFVKAVSLYTALLQHSTTMSIMPLSSKSFLFINRIFKLLDKTSLSSRTGRGNNLKPKTKKTIPTYTQIFCLSLRLMYHVRYIMVAATITNAKPPNLIFVLSHKDSSFSTTFSIYTESFLILLSESITLR